MLTIIGAINIDLLATTHSAYRPHDSNPASIQVSVGGVAMNYAHNLSLLKQSPRFLTVFSNDSLGQMAQNTCQKLGIDTSLSRVVPNSHANIFLCINNPDGDLESAACDASLTEQHLGPDFLATRLDVINSSSLVLADTNMSEDALVFLLDNCQAPLMADGVSIAKTERLVRAFKRAKHPHLHTLKLNEKEYQHFLSLTSDMDWSSKIDNLLITRGAEGVQIHHSIIPSFHHSFPALPISSIVSTLGAGDAFLSGWAYAYLHDYPLAEAIDFAQRMAIATLSVSGSVNPNLFSFS